MNAPLSATRINTWLLIVSFLSLVACDRRLNKPKVSLKRTVAVQQTHHASRSPRQDPRLADQVAFKIVPPRTAKPKQAVDVVLITLDTTRADYLQPYQKVRPTSPFLNALSEQGVTFTNAYATASWTSPSMASVMTGLYPNEHGVSDMVSEQVDPNDVGIPVLSNQALTLAEMLHGAGFKTFGVCTNMLVNAEAGFAQGYDEFVGEDTSNLPFPRVAVTSLLPHLRESERYFLWLHYFDAHWVYQEQAPWFDQWNDSSFRTGADFMGEATQWAYRNKHELGASDPIPPAEVPRLINQLLAINFDPNNLIESVNAVAPESERARIIDDYLRYLRAAYRSELRVVDYDMQRVLENIGVDDNTLLIVTSDHGDEFLDHGKLGHNLASLYNELIRVPLVVRLPGGKHAGLVIDEPVSLVDLVPSILDLLNLPSPTGLSGRSFANLIEGKKLEKRRELVSELNRVGEGNYRAVIRYPWKYIHSLRDNHGELYNLQNDAKERHNLVASEQAIARELRQWILNWDKTTKPHWPVPNTVALDEEDVNVLKALGYLSE